MKRHELDSDGYDPSEALKRLKWAAAKLLGGPTFRAIEPELADFLDVEVREALVAAFAKAEASYINKMFKQSEESSMNMFKACLAGAGVDPEEFVKKRHPNSKTKDSRG